MNKTKEFTEELKGVRPVTRSLVESVLMDQWPNQAAVAAFGIDSQKHYEALYYPIKAEQIWPQILDNALGDGERLTAMVRIAPANPHKDVEFYPHWDAMRDQESAWVKPELTMHDAIEGLLNRLEAFGEKFGRLAVTAEQKQLADSFQELVAVGKEAFHGMAGDTTAELIGGFFRHKEFGDWFDPKRQEAYREMLGKKVKETPDKPVARDKDKGLER